VSEPYDPHNLLDGISTASTLDVHYAQEKQREQEILTARLPLRGGDVLSVGCGWDPGRHLFPAPAWRMTGVELDPEIVHTLTSTGEIDEGIAARAGSLPFPPESFDVVLYRLVLHHVVFQGPLEALWSPLSQGRGIRWGSGSVSRTGSGSGRRCTGPRTTCRCRRGRWSRPRATPGSYRSYTRSRTGGGGCRRGRSGRCIGSIGTGRGGGRRCWGTRCC
jgi:hypothetical protein